MRILLAINVKKVFKNENQIYLHNDIVHTDERNPCDECGKTFNCKSYFEMHIREHHSIDGNTPCDKCGKKSSKMRIRSTYTTTAYIQMKEFLVMNVATLSIAKAISRCT